MTKIGIKLLSKFLHFFTNHNLYPILVEKKINKRLRRYIYGCEYKIIKRGGVIKNPIWVFWYQGYNDAPDLVKLCLKSIQANVPGNIIFLDKDNYGDYLTMPDHILKRFKEGRITITHFSDLLRLALLDLYGGTWIDSTVFVFNKIQYPYVLSRLFMFRISKYCLENKTTANWWINAEKNNLLIHEWLQSLLRYWSKENKLIDYFLTHKMLSIIVKNNLEFKQELDNMEYLESGPTHLLRDYLGKTYNKKDIQKIINASPIQKLTYKRKYKNEEDNLLMYLKKKYEKL